MATRLRAAGALSWDGYQRWKAAWNEYVSSLKPRKGGIATPVDKTLARAGRPFAQLGCADDRRDRRHVTSHVSMPPTQALGVSASV